MARKVSLDLPDRQGYQGRDLLVYLDHLVFLEKGARKEMRGRQVSPYLDPQVGLDNQVSLDLPGPQDPQDK